MAFVVGIVFFTFLQLSSASVQTPSLKPCSGNDGSSIAEIKNLTVTDLQPGKRTTFNYTLELKDKLPENSKVKFDIKSGGEKVPCIFGIGSCEYNLCGGNDKIGTQISKPWNNKCPAEAGTRENSVQVTIPSVANNFIKSPDFHVKIQAENEGTTLLCVEFDIKVQKN
ncbi:hypothetical protein V5799_005881 [Amblyomma americanum]|uniref:MD-2-related lipid-recognition domain-containing protein n=1 Tax=Amblyomma americanum TaxID=6943 RepID=A0AAQ4DY01_AMBAM